MSLTLRNTKGSKLTFTEMDDNFTHLGGDGTYQFPSTDGSADQVLSTNGSGQLSFVDQSGGGAAAGDKGSVGLLVVLPGGWAHWGRRWKRVGWW